MSRLQSVRGMHDVLPDEAQIRRRIEQVWIDAACGFGYEEIRFPLVESTALFQRSIGETTDIVEKEMYTFEDRNGESLSLRPEGTAGCVRAAIQHGLIPNRQQRLWYLGSFFRHERPQKGRLRQFDQFGVETFGMCGPDIDAEILLLGWQGWQRLGLSPQLMLNTLGNPDERAAWRRQLVDYFSRFESQLEDDDRRRLKTNPLRLLDSKSKSIQDPLEEAPRLEDLLGAESRAHFEGLREILDAHGIDYTLSPRLVRGWTTMISLYSNGWRKVWVPNLRWAEADAMTVWSSNWGGGPLQRLDSHSDWSESANAWKRKRWRQWTFTWLPWERAKRRACALWPCG